MFRPFLVAGVLATLAGSALAHATLEQTEVQAGATVKITLRVPHGCKGEATHNRGITLGQINTTIMQPPPYVSWAPGPVATHYTACMRGDHGTVHPDPDLSELWITCNGSFEITVFDMFTNEVKDRIPMPNGGSTHSGAFVTYEQNGNGWQGRVLSDQNGLHNEALDQKKSFLGLD